MLEKIGLEYKIGSSGDSVRYAPSALLLNDANNSAIISYADSSTAYLYKMSQAGVKITSSLTSTNHNGYIDLLPVSNERLMMIYTTESTSSKVLKTRILNATNLNLGGVGSSIVSVSSDFSDIAHCSIAFTGSNLLHCWIEPDFSMNLDCLMTTSAPTTIRSFDLGSAYGNECASVPLPDNTAIVAWNDKNPSGYYGQRINSTVGQVGSRFMLGSNHFLRKLKIASYQNWLLAVYVGECGNPIIEDVVCANVFNTSSLTPTQIGEPIIVANSTDFSELYLHPENHHAVVGWKEMNGTFANLYFQELDYTGTTIAKIGNKTKLSSIAEGAIDFPVFFPYQDKTLLAIWRRLNGTFHDVYGQHVVYKNPLTFVHNQLTISEGQAVTLNANNIQAQDPNDPTAIITYHVSNNRVGEWTLTTFTDTQLANGEVRYTHDGSENPVSFTITASTSTTSVNVDANVSFVFVNDAPIVAKSSLTITRGQSIILTPNEILVSDSDTADSNLIIQVANVQNAKVYFLSDPDTAITSFTMQNVREGSVGIVQDGSNNSPVLEFTVTDGALTSVVSTMNITYIPVSDTPGVNDAPVILNNNLKVRQGQTVLVTSANLQVIDPDTDPQDLLFTVSDVTAGHFELATEPDVAVTQFTQADVINKQLRFIHDNSEATPTYSLKVSDGASLSTVSTVVMTYINRNDAPIIVNPIPSRSFEVNKTFSFFVDPTKVFRDPDGDSLSYDLTQVDEDLTISMQQTNETNLEIFGELATSGNHDLLLSARDTGGLVANTSLSIFGIVNSPIVETPTPSSNLGAIIGGTVAAAGAVALVSGLMGYFWCGRSNDKSRKGHHFAAALCDRLKLKGLDSFDTPEGKKFVAFADALKQALYNDSGLDIEQEDDLFKGRVVTIASVIKANLSQETNCLGKSIITVSDLQSLDIQKLAQAITTKLKNEMDSPVQSFV